MIIFPFLFLVGWIFNWLLILLHVMKWRLSYDEKQTGPDFTFRLSCDSQYLDQLDRLRVFVGTDRSQASMLYATREALSKNYLPCSFQATKDATTGFVSGSVTLDLYRNNLYYDTENSTVENLSYLLPYIELRIITSIFI